MTDEKKPETWLPNLVGKVSIWKLAPDLNEPKFFDGRLLVPETEGSDSLPSKVEWNLTGLVPLKEAREKHPVETQAAIADFFGCLERARTELGNPSSGFYRFKDAFTVPSLDADGSYFFDPKQKKLFVINWGASPRAIGGREAFVFGYEAFDKLFAREKIAPSPVPSVAAPVAAIEGAPIAIVAAAAPANEPKKEDEKKKDGEKPGRPWWHWLLVVLFIAGIIVFILFLLRSCKDDTKSALDASADADGDVLADGETDGDALSDGEADGSTDAIDGDTALDSPDSPDAPDAPDGDATSDAKPDGDAKSDGDANDKDGGDGSGSGGGGGGGGGGGTGLGGGAGGMPDGTIVVVPGKGKFIVKDGNLVPTTAGEAELPHRGYFEPKAVKWRVTAGKEQLDPGSPLDGVGNSFVIHLKPGASDSSVKVQWQDAEGAWH